MGGRITENDRGPLINIATWICMVMMIFSVGVKVISKYAMVRKFQRDDFYMLGAGIVTLGQCIAASYQVAGGLGQHLDSLSPDLVDTYQKATYAAALLYIVSLCLARQAVLQFLVTLARGGSRRTTVNAVVLINAVWSLVTVISVLFECGIPRPWAIIDGQCFNKKIFWAIFGVMDVLLDLTIVGLPIFLLHDLQIDTSKKIWTMSAFGGRLVLVPLVILRMTYLADVSSVDRTWQVFSYNLITEVHVNVSVITACVPFLKPFMDSLQSGILTMDLATVAPGHSGGRSHARSGYGLNSSGKAGMMSGTSQSQIVRSQNRASILADTETYATADAERQVSSRGRLASFARGQGWSRTHSKQGNEATCTANGKVMDGNMDEGIEMHARHGSEDRMIIKATTTVMVTTRQMEEGDVDDRTKSRESFSDQSEPRTFLDTDERDTRDGR